MAVIWLRHAFEEIDVAEILGAGDAARVTEYLRATSLPPDVAAQDETPWCAAFVCWVLNRAQLGSTRSASARSFLRYGESVVASFGAIAVLTRGRPPSGHVGFLLSRRGGHIWLLGGNQSDRVSVARFEESRLIDCRWPIGAAGPRYVL